MSDESCFHCLGENGTLQLTDALDEEDPGIWVCEVCGEEVYNPSFCFPEE